MLHIFRALWVTVWLRAQGFSRDNFWGRALSRAKITVDRWLDHHAGAMDGNREVPCAP